MKRAGPGLLLIALAGLAAVFGAFLPFYTYADGIDVTVWSRGLFPTATLIPLLGIAVGVEALFALVRGHEPRSPFLNFTWEQLRLAAGAFMILLALSYLLHDRAGGALGIGYVLLSASSLATFAGGVLTRRAQLARAPGEEVAAEERRPVIKPALASVSRASSDLVKNVADRSHSMRVRLAERREARAVARKEAAEQAAARRAETQADAAAASATTTAEQVAEGADEPEESAQPAPPAATVETLPAEPHPPAATLEELPADEPAEQPAEEPTPEPAEATKPLDVTSPAAKDATDTEDTEDTAELPVADTAEADTEKTDEKTDEKTIEQPRVAKLSAVPSESDPDATLPSDGESPDRAEADEAEKNEEEEREEPEEKEKERADTGAEGSPGS